MNSSIAFPLLLTLLAGLATGIGSAIAFFAHRTNVRFLSFSLGLSAGVMIYVSFVELFAESQALLTAQWGATAGVSAGALVRESARDALGRGDEPPPP